MECTRILYLLENVFTHEYSKLNGPNGDTIVQGLLCFKHGWQDRRLHWV